MIEAVKGTGVPRAKVVCDDCQRTEVVACDYQRASNGDWSPNTGQIVRKLTKQGWAQVKGHLRCPACEAKRKARPMEQSKTKTDPAPAREPTREERRAIMDILNDVYDTENECYRRGDTDETVAEVLSVMPGWVGQIREQFFGASGRNDDMAELKAEVTAFLKTAEASLIEMDAAKTALAEFDKSVAQAKDLLARLVKIEAAVGKRVMRRAK